MDKINEEIIMFKNYINSIRYNVGKEIFCDLYDKIREIEILYDGQNSKKMTDNLQLGEVRKLTPKRIKNIAKELSNFGILPKSDFKDGMYSGIQLGIEYILKKLR